LRAARGEQREAKKSHMASINLLEAFQEFKDAENIDRPTLMRVVEDVFKTLLSRNMAVMITSM